MDYSNMLMLRDWSLMKNDLFSDLFLNIYGPQYVDVEYMSFFCCWNVTIKSGTGAWLGRLTQFLKKFSDIRKMSSFIWTKCPVLKGVIWITDLI